MAEQNPILIQAIRKLALAGEQAGLSTEEMIELLKTGVSVEALLNLICRRSQVETEMTFGSYAKPSTPFLN